MLMQRIDLGARRGREGGGRSGSVPGLNATPTERPCARAAAATPAGSSVASTWNVTESAPEAANSWK